MWIAMTLSPDRKSAFKLAQILKCMEISGSIKSFEKILDKEGDINYAIPVDDCHQYRGQFPSGSTALHFAYEESHLGIFSKLLDIGADFTKQNIRNQTVLHMMVQDPKKINRPLDEPYINAVLSAHINTNNFSNPYDDRGLSHFHIACMSKNATAVQFFLDNGIPADEPINVATQLLPGFTPLHLAAMYTNTEVVELLLANGANMHATDVSGMTVLHALIKCRIEMFDSIGKTLRVDNGSYEQLQLLIRENEIIINILMEKMSSDNDCLDHIGLSNFQVACMLRDTSVAQHLIDYVTNLDHSLNADSLLWPGYTALHFAAHVSLDNVEMLVKKGANFGKQNSAGDTPLDICIERYKIEDVCRIMSLNADWINITLSDGETKLISFLLSFTNRNQYKRLVEHSFYDMNMFVPMESPLWPGFRPLHLAVRFAEKSNQMFKEVRKDVDLQIIRLCLKNGSDLSVKDKRGRTAFHLAYRLKKMEVVDLILHQSHRIPNAFDKDNLSHLHIVCAVSKTSKTFRKCLIDDSDVNEVYKGTSSILKVRPGSTPLHVCLGDNNYNNHYYEHKIKELLRYSVDPDIKDAYGLTPIHWFLNTYASYGMKINPLLKLVSKDCVAKEYGLSYLHVACHLNDVRAVKRLLKNGADANMIIEYKEKNKEDSLLFLSRYEKHSPLSIIGMSYVMPKLANLLVDHGADVYSEIVSASGVTWAPKFSILNVLWNNIELQTLMRREFGWTRLHLACYSLKGIDLEDAVRTELADVNAKVYPNSTFWKGCTPLHLLMQKIGMENVHLVSEILLENGSDVTVIDDQQNTPITIMFKYPPDDLIRTQTALLLKYHRNFNVNPVNSQGISHFHLACWLNDVDAVRGFLSHGVEVNCQIDYFVDWSPGCTPLHLAPNVQIVDLLINHGADTNIEDVSGHTALHTAVKRDAFDESIIKRLAESGADVNVSNYIGETPFEIALSRHAMNMDQLKFFIRQGFLVNSCNPISGVGYIAMASCHYYHDKGLQKLILEKIMNESPTNIFGRTTLHYLVTKRPSIQPRDYALLIEKVIKSGCDIDGQDHNGRTALHLAVELRCTKTIQVLLMCGADINVVDEDGNSAISYASFLSASKHPESDSVEDILIIYAYRLAFLKLELSHSNRATASRARKSLQDYAANQDFRQQIVTAKAIELGVRSMRLSDFLSETGAVAAYRLLNEIERSKIDQYFQSIHDETRLKEIKGFLKLQYRKAVKRSEIYSSAICSFVPLLRFDLPYLCADNIIQYLSNSDLQNIISARIDDEDRNMDVD